VVTAGSVVPPETLVAGAPARAKKRVSGNALWWVENAAAEYRDLRLRYLRASSLLSRP